MKQSRNDTYDSVGIQAWTVANKKLYLHHSVGIPSSLPRTFKAYDVHIQQTSEFKVSLSKTIMWKNGSMEGSTEEIIARNGNRPAHLPVRFSNVCERRWYLWIAIYQKINKRKAIWIYEELRTVHHCRDVWMQKVTLRFSVDKPKHDYCLSLFVSWATV